MNERGRRGAVPGARGPRGRGVYERDDDGLALYYPDRQHLVGRGAVVVVVGVHYNAKAGLEGLTRGHAARVVKDGVTVDALAPSLIATEMIKPHRSGNLAKIPVGRLGRVDGIASAVLMVVGNAYMTGQTVAANGGLHFN